MTKTDKYYTELQQLHSRIEDLGQQCDIWQDGLYKSSNAELYNILQGCFDLLVELRTASSLRRKFSKALEMAGYKVQANTSLSLQIVRAIFKSKGQRMYGYARVLEIAFDKKPAGQTLADFIAAWGGIEEIRRASKNGVPHADQRNSNKELAADVLAESTPLCSLPSRPELMPHPEATNDFSVALVRHNDNGTTEIVFGSNKTSLVDAVLAEAGKVLGEQHAQFQTATQHAEHRQQRDAMLEEMAA